MNKFLNAVGQIDEELLDKYDKIEKTLVPQRKNRRVLKALSIAACFCIIVGSVIAVLSIGDEPEIPFYSDITSSSSSFESRKPEDENSSVASGDVSGLVSNPEQSEITDITSQGGDNSQNSEYSQPDESSQGDVSGGETSNGETSVPAPPNELNHTVSKEPLWMNPSASGNAQSGGQAAEPPPTYVLFSKGMTAMGRVKSILPDTYARIGASSAELRYRVIVMEITESVYGQNLPNEIFLTVPSYLDAEALLNYEEIMFTFLQSGFENYILANETQKCAEVFSMMFETVSAHSNFCFSPFTNGVFDISLWKCKGWKNRFYKEEYMIEFFTDGEEFPIHIGFTTEQAKKAVLDSINDWPYPPLDHIITAEAAFGLGEVSEVMSYCAPFANGIFAQSAYVKNPAIWYTRYIYGFATNEEIRIRKPNDGVEVTYYGEKFTKEEIERLPNIADFFENTDIDSLSPMHTDITDKLTVSKAMIAGKYIKYDGKIYSVARIGWKIIDDRNWYCNDNTYFLISEDGSATLIEREELRTLAGDDVFITTFEYNKYEEELAIAE